MASLELLPSEQLHRAAHHLTRAAHAVSQSNAAFLALAIPAAQRAQVETGVPASITLAQACIESGWGHHHIGAANNYFGIKAPEHHGHHSLGTIAIGYVMATTAEYDNNHEKIFVQQPFRAYSSMEDSFRDHGVWIRDNHRYGDMLARFAQDGNADAVAHALEHGGYAGAYNTVYAEQLIAMMKIHDLYKYDRIEQPRHGHLPELYLI